MPDIQVDVSYEGPNQEVAIIAARGFIDTTTAPELEKKLEEQLALSKYKIVVNLENIDYVSSAGWGVFVSEIREIRENNGDLVLVKMSPDVYDVYELMEFSSILKSFDSMQEAVANFTGKEAPKEEPRQISRQAAQSSPSPKTGRPVNQPGVQVAGQGGQQQTEQPPAQGRPAAVDVFSQARSELGRRIIQVIIDNPYYEVREIARALKEPRYGGRKTGGGAVKRELKEMGLLDKSNRFELALRGRS